MELHRKRAYDTAESGDGFRILVDRLWPRGVSKERARIDLWAKDVAPSAALRKAWHAASGDEWEVCVDRYRAELATESAAALEDLAAEVKKHPVITLVYAVRDEEHTHAIVLEEALGELL